MQHSDPAEIKKSIKTYLMIGAALYLGTIITVAVNQVHLAVPLAITVALIVAATKGSMVAAVFMHLNHEKKWIYGSLILTVVFFIVLMFVPMLTIHDGIGRPLKHAATSAFQEEAVQSPPGAASKEH
jgi:caa(3)-type oxidase subunit IV